MTGISRLMISARDAGKALESLAALTDDRRARGDTFRVGPQELVVVTADSPEDDVEQRLETSGSGPFAAELTVLDGGQGELDLKLTQGVRLRLC